MPELETADEDLIITFPAGRLQELEPAADGFFITAPTGRLQEPEPAADGFLATFPTGLGSIATGRLRAEHRRAALAVFIECSRGMEFAVSYISTTARAARAKCIHFTMTIKKAMANGVSR